MLPPFGWTTALTQWQSAPAVTALVLLFAALYLWGTLRVAKRHPARPWPVWRTSLFLAGLAVIVIGTESGVGSYDDVLFWDHMVQHLILIMVAPPLLIAGQPITLLLHASRNPVHTWTKRVVRSRVASFLTWPVFGILAYAAVIVVAHLSAFASYADTNRVAHDLEHAVFLIVGYLFFLPIIGREPIRWRLSYPVRFVILVLIMPVDTFTGLVLGYGSASSPGVPTGPRPIWAPAPVQDLHQGGAIMWIAGDGLMFGLMMFVFLMWSQDDRAAVSGHGWFEQARRENLAALVGSHPQPPDADAASPVTKPQAARGGIDDDEHLAAYNAYLARLNQPPKAGTN